MTDLRSRADSVSDGLLRWPGLALIWPWRRFILGLVLIGGLVGLAVGLLLPRKFSSEAMFIPQSAESSFSTLALAASQFGITVPSSGGAWGAPVFVELLRSRALLEPIVLDSVELDDGRRAAVMDLLQVDAENPAERVEKAVIRLRKWLAVSEDKRLGAVVIAVTTRWPKASLALAEMLVASVDRFNVATRKSQAAAERRFVEQQATEAKQSLRSAEERLETFFARNRRFEDSPDLRFEHDRLQRDVTLRQAIYTSLMQSQEEARIKEVRDTPVVTMIEEPRLPALGRPRRLFMATVLGAVLAGMFGIIAASLFGTTLRPLPQRD